MVDGGAYAEDALSLHWQYPIVDLDWDEDGVTDYAYYDTDNCLLEENTWVSIQAQVIPEYESATANANDTVTFTLYIDTSAPLSPENFIFTDRNIMAAEFGGEEHDGMYHVVTKMDEYWFMDYEMSISLDYDEESGKWMGMIFTGTYASNTPAKGEMGIGDSGFYPFNANSKFMYLGYDYAGNVSAYELQGGEYLLDWIDLKPDTVFLRPGDTMTVENVVEHSFGVEASWLLSDDTVAEIVESDGSSCVIRGLKPGEAQVSAGFNDYRKAVTVTVIDPDVAGRYTDIGNHWAKDSIEAALTLGFFQGTSSTTFSPEKTLTRAEMVTVLYRMAGTPEATATNPFRDVAPDRWYTDAVTWAAANGIVLGKTADRFDPNAPVTREQIASILYRYATYLGMDVSARSELSGYSDAGKISNYAKEAMSWAVATGLIHGMTHAVLSPGGSATRAQAATLAIRFRGL